MARRRRRREDPVATAAKTVALPFRVKSKIGEAVRPTARVLGALGVGLLVGCGVLALTPPDAWPRGLAPRLLPVYTMVSLTIASLLGWCFVSDGQKRISRRLPESVAAFAFVAMPIVCAILGLFGERVVTSMTNARWPWHVVHWYGPVLVVLNLVAFLTWKSRGRSGRGVWFALLVAPYAALFAYFVFGVRISGIDGVHHTTLAALGSWALALQLVLSFFVGGGE